MNAHILIVEDDLLTSNALLRTLTYEGYKVYATVNDLLTLARSDEMAQELTTLVRVNNAMYFSFDDRRPNHPLYVRYSQPLSSPNITSIVPDCSSLLMEILPER